MATTVLSDLLTRTPCGGWERIVRLEFDSTTLTTDEEVIDDLPLASKVDVHVLEAVLGGAGTAATIQPALGWAATPQSGSLGFISQAQAAGTFIRLVGLAGEIAPMPAYLPTGELFLAPNPNANLDGTQIITCTLVLRWGCA